MPAAQAELLPKPTGQQSTLVQASQFCHAHAQMGPRQVRQKVQAQLVYH